MMTAQAGVSRQRGAPEDPRQPGIAGRVRAQDWQRLSEDLDAHGNARIESLLTRCECQRIARWYADDSRYFAYPLPQSVAALRAEFYPPLAVLANRWNERLRVTARYPMAHEEFVARCRTAGQSRPTPLLLQYGVGDYNCLHQDLYGECVFPLQVAMLLSQPGVDFSGGEFIITEQRPRLQSRAEVVPLRQGDAVIFAVHHRPVAGTRGVYRVNLRHGVSRVRTGHRHTLGVIFHDAR